MAELVDVDTVARWLGLEIRCVRQLAKEGTIPKTVGGKYNLEKCVAGYSADLRGGGRPDQVINFAAERARLTKLRADTLDTELETMLQTLVPSEIVIEILGVVGRNIRGKLLAFPGCYSPRLANRTATQVKGIQVWRRRDSADAPDRTPRWPPSRRVVRVALKTRLRKR